MCLLRLTALDKKLWPWGLILARKRIKSLDPCYPSVSFIALRSIGKSLARVLSQAEFWSQHFFQLSSDKYLLSAKYNEDKLVNVHLQELRLYTCLEKKKTAENPKKSVKKKNPKFSVAQSLWSYLCSQDEVPVPASRHCSGVTILCCLFYKLSLITC